MISISFCFLFLAKTPQKIVVIDRKELLREFIVNIAKSMDSNDEETVRKRTKIYKKKLEELDLRIDQIAKEKNLIVLDKAMILGGGEDQTEYTKTILNNRINQSKPVKNDK